MTRLKLTPAEIRLLDIQQAQGIPYPPDVLTWRKAHAAAIAGVERELREVEAEADASR